ncbi:MAG: hypothetical protein AAFY15_17090, partial [Cyanobacteria bacterium J06648_11]
MLEYPNGDRFHEGCTTQVHFKPPESRLTIAASSQFNEACSQLIRSMTDATSPSSFPSRQTEFWQGGRASIPLMVGAAPFGIIIGTLGASSDLSV